MLLAEGGGSVRPVSPPQPSSSSPTRHVVKAGETMRSVAHQYPDVTPQSVADKNHLPVDATLHSGQILDIPSPNYYTAVGSSDAGDPTESAPKELTPKQKTDAAAKAYKKALKHRNQAMQSVPTNVWVRGKVWERETQKVNAAHTAFDKAVKAEIAHHVNEAKAKAQKRYDAIPPQVRHGLQITPPHVDTAKVAQKAERAIEARYVGDSSPVEAVVKTAIHEYQAQQKAERVQQKAEELVPYYGTDMSAADKLKGIDLEGQPKDVVQAVLKNPRVKAWIKQAAADIGKPYHGVSNDDVSHAFEEAFAAGKKLSTVTEGMPPQLAAAVVQASMPTIRKIALQGQNGMTPAFNCVYSAMCHLGDDPQSKAAMAQVAQVFADHVSNLPIGYADAPEGLIANDASLHTDPRFAIALANALRSNGKTGDAERVLQAAAAGIGEGLKYQGSGAKAAYEEAHKAAESKDEHLAELLAKAGPLTKEQKAAFIKAYRKDPANAKVYKAEANAAKKLSGWMNAHKAALLFAAGRDSEAAKQLYGMMKDLAQSGQGVMALKFVGAIKSDPAAAAAFDKFSDYQNTFTDKALEKAQAELLLESNGNTQEAAKELLELADPVFKGKAGWDKVKEGYRNIANGDTSKKTVQEFAQSYKEMGKAGKAWAIASIMTSAANGLTHEQIDEVINGFARAGADTAELSTGAMQALADAGKYGEATGTLAKLGTRFVPWLGALASSAAFASDFHAMMEGNPANAIAMAGDLASVVGSALEATPFAPVGAVLNGVGTLWSAVFGMVGKLIDGNKERKEFQEEQVKYLKAAGVGENEAQLLAKDGASANLLSKQLHLSPGQTQKLLVNHPEVFDQGEGTQYAQAIVDLVKASGVKPSDVDGFLTALAQDSQKNVGDPSGYVRRFYNLYLQHHSGGVYDQFTYGDRMVDTVLQGGFKNAKAFLQQHSPDVAGPAGAARRKADNQYQTTLRVAYNPTNIVNLLNSDKDAAYQAQIIKDMKQSGRLDTWVRDVSTTYGANDGVKAARHAIQAAQKAGVLTGGQAQNYLNELG